MRPGCGRSSSPHPGIQLAFDAAFEAMLASR